MSSVLHVVVKVVLVCVFVATFVEFDVPVVTVVVLAIAMDPGEFIMVTTATEIRILGIWRHRSATSLPNRDQRTSPPNRNRRV